MKYNFEAIIFDLGGVILNIDYQKTIDAFTNLGIGNFEELYTQAQQNDLFDSLEVGEISNEHFYDEIKKIAGISLSTQQIQTAWNAMLLDLPVERVVLLREISKTKPIFLLSNTNAIHLEAFQNMIEVSFGKRDLLEQLFIETFYSHQIGARKPNPEAFNCIIEKHKLVPENTLFIDDSAQHISGAKKMGLQTHHLVSEDLTELFSNG